jgi:hypothetical protein
MNHVEKAKAVQEQYMEGRIPVEELLLHIEPILAEFASDSSGQAEVRRIVNAIERITFKENEPHRSSKIVEQLDAAVAFLGHRLGA